MKKLLPLLVALSGLGLTSPGCLVSSKDSSQLVITGVAAVQPPDCIITPSTTVFRGRGVVDLNVASAYLIPVILTNNMPNNANPLQGTTDGRTAIIEGFKLSYRLDGFSASLQPRYVHQTVVVGSSGGKSGAGVIALNSVDIDILRGDAAFRRTTVDPLTGRFITNRFGLVIVNLQATGRLTDGSKIASTEISYPIDVCRGCLQQPLPPENDCDPTTQAEPPDVTPVCNPGQDASMDFCSYEQLAR